MELHEMNQEFTPEFEENRYYCKKKNCSSSSYEDEKDKNHEYSRKRSRRDRSYTSSERSRSPHYYRRTRYHGSREHPNRSRILGVFGLTSRTVEDDLMDVFSRYGRVEDVRIVYDVKSGNSRGFGFIYFDHIDDASTARRKCNGMRLNGKRIRVDYSITKRPHTPTPGIYMGSRRRTPNEYPRHRYYSPYARYSSHRSRSHSR